MTRRSENTAYVLVGVGVPEAVRDVLQGVVAYVQPRQLNWRVRCVDSHEFVAMLSQRPADGGIASLSPINHEQIAAIRTGSTPVVNMVQDCHPDLPSVLADERATGRLAAQFFLRRGYRNFAYVGFDAAWSRGRHRGFADELAGAGRLCHVCAPLAAMTHYRFLDAPGSAQLLQAWMADLPKPVAVFVCSDPIAASALEIWSAGGIRVPEEAAVMGVGNLIATCELAPVPLSSVAADFPGMGYHAARILDGLMRGELAPTEPTLLAPPGIITRRSTDAFTFDDEHVRAAMRIIHDRAAGGLTIKELLRQVPVSRKWLDVRFKEIVGHTPSQEMRKLRLERVRELLVNTDLSVQQIATLSGFSRAENLIRFFRDAYGSPPSAYRSTYGQAQLG